jgi:enoyl-CoA hydratase/carnithine racemase
MDDIVTEEVGSILRVQLNRPTKRNAMTSAMYAALARIFNQVANDENMQVVLSFCAGNDIENFQGQANRHRQALGNWQRSLRQRCKAARGS